MADLVSDNEEAQILWLGSVTSPQLLSDLFGVEDVHSINTQMVRRAVLTIAGMADTDPPSPSFLSSIPCSHNK